MSTAAALALVLAAAALLAAGPRGAGRALAEVARALAAEKASALGALAALAVLLVLGARYVPTAAYLAQVASSSLAFLSLLVLGLRFETIARRAADALLAAPPLVVAGAVVLAALALQAFVHGAIPHVTDEVAYQFQARALAQGRLGFAPPELPEFFDFTHVSRHGGVWHGIMNPGWPALLAVGYALGAPRLVNPLLAGATLLLLLGFLRRSGSSEPAARLAIAALAVSPFFLFMSGTWMSHPATLFLFALFAWASTQLEGRRAPAAAALAGVALGLNLLVRPQDALALSAPLGMALVWRARREPRRLLPLAAIGALAAGGLALLGLYNRALTGDPLLFPQTLEFERRFPGQSFGIGFGPQMGSRLHGPEWPGFYPADSPVVTSHRLLQLLLDVHALPLGLLLAWAHAARRRPRGGEGLLQLAALAAVALYAAHFYHGIAYGSRHLYGALPAAAVALAAPVARALARGGRSAALARAALLALVLHSAVYAFPPLAREYGERYRDASPALREAVRAAGLAHALVFVAAEEWGWKSGFPLNEFPLERSDVLFARDLGERNALLRARHPERSAWRAVHDASGRVTLERLP